MPAALFDMDRTLLRGESASAFVRHQFSRGEADLCDLLRVAWWLGQYTLGVIDIETVSTRALAKFRGRTEAWMERSCAELFDRYLASQIRDEGRRAVEDHKGRGDIVAIVTGASEFVARPLAARLGIEHVVATRLEAVDGVFTGRPELPMCYGVGKVVHMLDFGQRLGFALDQSTFYTDSITDLPLLERVQAPIVIDPDIRLRWVAHRRNWPIIHW